MVIWKNKSRTLLRNGKELVEKGAYMLDLLLRKYTDRFGENFPIFMLMGVAEDDLIDILKKSIQNGIPYQLPDTDPDVLF